MIHYTCDRCQCSINPAEQMRYVVHIDVQCVGDGPIEEDESIDHLSLINDVLEAEQADPSFADADHTRVDMGGEADDAVTMADDLEADGFTEQQYDLCPTCYRKYRRDPLAQARAFSLHFSAN